MKQTIRLNERQFRQIVTESVKRVLNEEQNPANQLAQVIQNIKNYTINTNKSLQNVAAQISQYQENLESNSNNSSDEDLFGYLVTAFVKYYDKISQNLSSTQYAINELERCLNNYFGEYNINQHFQQ